MLQPALHDAAQAPAHDASSTLNDMAATAAQLPITKELFPWPYAHCEHDCVAGPALHADGSLTSTLPKIHTTSTPAGGESHQLHVYNVAFAADARRSGVGAGVPTQPQPQAPPGVCVKFVQAASNACMSLFVFAVCEMATAAHTNRPPRTARMADAVRRHAAIMVRAMGVRVVRAGDQIQAPQDIGAAEQLLHAKSKPLIVL